MYKQQILQFSFFSVFWCGFFGGDAAKMNLSIIIIIICPQVFKHKAHLDITFLLSVFFCPQWLLSISYYFLQMALPLHSLECFFNHFFIYFLLTSFNCDSAGRYLLFYVVAQGVFDTSLGSSDLNLLLLSITVFLAKNVVKDH